MACDICGKRGTPLNDLRSIYQTDDIKSICPECEKVVNGKLSALQKWTSTLIRRLLKLFIRERAAQAKQGGANHG